MAFSTATQPLRQLIAFLVQKHHRAWRQELPFLEECIGAMATNYGQERPELFVIQQLLQNLRDDLLVHLQKEETVLFRYITDLEEAQETGAPSPRRCFPSLRFPLRVMLMEHDGAEALLSELRSMTTGYTAPAGLCESGREFYTRLQALDTELREHIRLENEILFKRAVALEESAAVSCARVI